MAYFSVTQSRVHRNHTAVQISTQRTRSDGGQSTKRVTNQNGLIDSQKLHRILKYLV